MKRTVIAAILVAACFVLASCSDPTACTNLKVTNMKFMNSGSLATETQGLLAKFNNNKEQVLGFSPDGREAVLRTVGTISLLSTVDDNDQSVAITPDVGLFVGGKHAEWTRDGKSFLFVDNSVFSDDVPSNVCVFNTEPGISYDRATNNDVSKNIKNGGNFLYSESFSWDEKSVIFTKNDKSGWYLCKSDIATQDEKVLLPVDGKANGEDFITEAIEIKNDLLFCVRDNHNDKHPDKLFLYDCSTNRSTYIDNRALNLPPNFMYFDIKGWSVDRQTVLVAAWCNQPIKDTPLSVQWIKAFYVFRFDNSSICVQRIAMDDITGDTRECRDAVLSADGEYIASYETRYKSPKNNEVSVYSLDSSQRQTLETNPVELVWNRNSTTNEYHQSFFFTNDKRLIVSYLDSWKVYKLS